MLVLQSLYNLSDEQVEYQVRDRLSFTRFLGLGIEDGIPDGTTLWLFRETLDNKLWKLPRWARNCIGFLTSFASSSCRGLRGTLN
jgi:IS5 family transposase